MSINKVSSQPAVKPGAAPAAEPPSNSLGPAGLPNALSVDVEDYYHVEAFADRIRPEDWPGFPSRVAANTRRVLELFSEMKARATFFVLGCVAEKEPALVREIAASGHELACHSHMHRRVFTMSTHEFREDLRRARGAIEDAGGECVAGFRAPTFSINEKSFWALDVLAEEGFEYDSSVFPVRHDLYGMPQAPRFPFHWRLESGKPLLEIPPLTVRVFGRNLPAAGGGYLRILPLQYTLWAMRRVRKREGHPAVIYFHPWEIDPRQPRLSGSLKSKLRHYSNLGKMERKLRKILAYGRFETFKAFIEKTVASGAPLSELAPRNMIG